VLYEWNDRLNLNLALMGTYLGESARDWLDLVIYENFRSVGGETSADGRRNRWARRSCGASRENRSSWAGHDGPGARGGAAPTTGSR
jgi:hypothetical protein